MGLQVELVSADAVRGLIARQILGDEADWQEASGETEILEGQLGSVRLHPHQISAIRRIRSALEEFGGALLCDEVGMGKTFVALAIAKGFAHCVVVAPAVLRDMWSQQARIAGVQLSFASFEQLSRRRRPVGEFDLVVIDEAHHARNRSTRRYSELSHMVMRSRVLLLTATPVHNSRRDLEALLALFLGSRAESLSGAELGRCVIRREIEAAGLASKIPDAGAVSWLELSDDREIPEALMSLPPPLPVRDGGLGGVLIARSLVRQWCSSDAALESAVRRRLGRSIALIAALESGHYPSEHELSAWTIGDDSIQLAFPSLIAESASESGEMLETVRAHRNALREVLGLLRHTGSRDAERARVLTGIRRSHPGIPVVAFSQSAETVNALFREMRREPGVAALTARGARVAGGLLTRREAISRFAPRASGARVPREAERIDLLLATDLLSEGINLQDAGVVVHLDLPWTAARLEQRLGRVARLGSERGRVHAYGIRPSASAELIIRMESTIRRKLRETEDSIGRMHDSLPAEPGAEAVSPIARAPATATEGVRACLQRWRSGSSFAEGIRGTRGTESILTASVASARRGFVALCRCDGTVALLASNGTCLSDEPGFVLAVLAHGDGAPVKPCAALIADALALLESRSRALRTAGVTEDASAHVARCRRVALRRLSAILENARPHERARLRKLTQDARDVILGRMNAAAEAELVRLSAEDMSDEDWLTAISDRRAGNVRGTIAVSSLGRDSLEPQILAILVLDDQ